MRALSNETRRARNQINQTKAAQLFHGLHTQSRARAQVGRAAHTTKCSSDRLQLQGAFPEWRLWPTIWVNLLCVKRASARGFCIFLDNPSTLYMFISKEKGDECLVGVVMLFLSGQSPSFCFEVCHHIACLNAFFFFSRHSALSNWDILLLHHTKSPYMNAHLSQLTRKAFKVHHPCSRAKAKKLGPTKCPILPPFKSAAKHWSPWLSADKYENGQRNAH